MCNPASSSVYGKGSSLPRESRINLQVVTLPATGTVAQQRPLLLAAWTHSSGVAIIEIHTALCRLHSGSQGSFHLLMEP